MWSPAVSLRCSKALRPLFNTGCCACVYLAGTAAAPDEAAGAAGTAGTAMTAALAATAAALAAPGICAAPVAGRLAAGAAEAGRSSTLPVDALDRSLEV